MHSISIQFQNLTLWTIAIIAVIAGILFLSFRKTDYRIFSNIWILFFIRCAVMILLLIIIVKPIIKWTTVEHLEPCVDIFVDRSASMSAHQNVSADSLRKIVKMVCGTFQEQGVKVRVYPFSYEVEPEIRTVNELQWNAGGTNLSDVLIKGTQRLPDENIQAAIMITDGVFTQGEDPLLMNIDSEFPIYTLGIGDSMPILDPAVVEILVPSTAEVGDSITIEARILPLGRQGTIDIFLKQDNAIIQKKVVQTSLQNLYRSVQFEIVFGQPGIKEISVVIDTLHDRNPFNNIRMGQINVRPNRTNIVMIQGVAGFESRFFSNLIQSIRGMEYYGLLEVDNQLRSTTATDPFQIHWDAVVLSGFPTAKTLPGLLNSVRSKIATDQPAVFIFTSDKTNFSKMNRILKEEIIIIADKSRNIEPILVQVPEEQKGHPIIRDIDTGAGLKNIWAELPPVGMAYRRIKLAGFLNPILETANSDKIPVLATGISMGTRYGVAIGTDLWRWDMLTKDNENQRIYAELGGGLIKWLTDTLSTSNLQLYLNKRTYLTGEFAEIKGIVTDVQGNLVKNAVVNARLIDSRNNSMPFLIQWDGFQYAGKVHLQSEGDYRIEASASVRENVLGQFSQEISVLENSIEFSTIRQNVEVLRTIAQKTGGKYIQTIDIQNLFNTLSLDVLDLKKQHELKLWRWNGVLIILILLLLSEWIIRRLSGYQ